MLLANRITLLDDSGVSEVVPLCAERDVSVIAGGVFNSGVLANPRGDTRYEYRRVPDDVRLRALALERTCERHGVALAAAAAQFPMRHEAVAAVVVGVRSVEEVDANVSAFGAGLPEALWDDLRDA